MSEICAMVSSSQRSAECHGKNIVLTAVLSLRAAGESPLINEIKIDFQLSKECRFSHKVKWVSVFWFY